MSLLVLTGEEETIERYPFTAATPVVDVRDTRAPLVLLVLLEVWGWEAAMGWGRLELLRIG